MRADHHAFDLAAPILPSTLISLSSYIFSHAFLSPRSRIYSRLTLNLLTLLVDDAGDGKLCYVGDEKAGGEKELKEPQIRMCRQVRYTIYSYSLHSGHWLNANALLGTASSYPAESER